MTKGDVVARMRNSVKQHYSDSVLSNRFLWSSFRTAAITIMEKDKRSLYNDTTSWETVSIDTEKVNLSENTCVPLDCKVCRVELPDSLSTSSGFLYKYVGSDYLTHIAIQTAIQDLNIFLQTQYDHLTNKNSSPQVSDQ